jgi:2'-5' RNA ligase
MIRLFTALIIPEEIKQKLLSTCHSLVDNPEQYRWVGADKIHLTLKFIGEVEEDLTEPIKSILIAALADLDSFSGMVSQRFSGWD